MTLNTTLQLLDSYLQSLLSPLGFERLEPLIYSRSVNEATGLLTFASRLDANGLWHFSCYVGIRFESVERWLRGPSAKQTIPTVTIPLHLLRENKAFLEWSFNRIEDLENLQLAISTDLTRKALPFIERYSNLDEVHSQLESPNPDDWFVLDPESRVNILAVIHFVQGDKAGAMSILTRALQERREALHKKRAPIEVVKRRLTDACAPC
jgi:hypothetical protein